MGKEIKNKVEALLTEYPIYRESRRYIQARIWQEQAYEMELNSVEDFLKAYANGDLANAESIRRSAAKIQESNPSLRATKKTLENNEKLEQIIRTNKGEL